MVVEIVTPLAMDRRHAYGRGNLGSTVGEITLPNGSIRCSFENGVEYLVELHGPSSGDWECAVGGRRLLVSIHPSDWASPAWISQTRARVPLRPGSAGFVTLPLLGDFVPKDRTRGGVECVAVDGTLRVEVTADARDGVNQCGTLDGEPLRVRLQTWQDYLAENSSILSTP